MVIQWTFDAHLKNPHTWSLIQVGNPNLLYQRILRHRQARFLQSINLVGSLTSSLRVIALDNLSQRPFASSNTIDPVDKGRGTSRHPNRSLIAFWIFLREVKGTDENSSHIGPLFQERHTRYMPQAQLQWMREIDRKQFRRVGILSSNGGRPDSDAIKSIFWYAAYGK